MLEKRFSKDCGQTGSGAGGSAPPGEPTIIAIILLLDCSLKLLFQNSIQIFNQPQISCNMTNFHQNLSVNTTLSLCKSKSNKK